MLQGCLTPLRQQLWPTNVGGSSFLVFVRTAKRKHLRIASRKKAVAANKAKVSEVEKEFVPYKLRLLRDAKPKVRVEEKFKNPPTDDVWIQQFYAKPVFSLAKAVEMHRQICHPTIMNAPDSKVELDIELNMKLEKETRYLENVKGIFFLPHIEEQKVIRSVVAICKTQDDQAKALEAGAATVGHMSVIQGIEKGDLRLDKIDYIVCHTDSILEVVKLRGLLKKQFPDKKRGTLGTDIPGMVNLFAKGLEFNSTKDWGETLWANVKFNIGRLDMPIEHLEENTAALVKAIAAQKGLEYGHFINKAFMRVNGSEEQFLVDLNVYAPQKPPDEPKKIKAKEPEISVAKGDEKANDAGDEKVAPVVKKNTKKQQVAA